MTKGRRVDPRLVFTLKGDKASEKHATPDPVFGGTKGDVLLVYDAESGDTYFFLHPYGDKSEKAYASRWARVYSSRQQGGDWRHTHAISVFSELEYLWGRVEKVFDVVHHEDSGIPICNSPTRDYIVQAFGVVHNIVTRDKDAIPIPLSIASPIKKILLEKYSISCDAQLDNITHMGDKDSLFANCDVQRFLAPLEDE